MSRQSGVPARIGAREAVTESARHWDGCRRVSSAAAFSARGADIFAWSARELPINR